MVLCWDAALSDLRARNGLAQSDHVQPGFPQPSWQLQRMASLWASLNASWPMLAAALPRDEAACSARALFLGEGLLRDGEAEEQHKLALLFVF